MNVKKLARAGIIAAIYVALTLLTQPISFGMLQVRVSEALTLLPFIFPEAIWGVTVGCLIANIFGGTVLDVIFGTLATLLAAIITRKMKSVYLAPLPPIILNGLIVGSVVAFNIYAEPNIGVIATVCLMVAAGEAVSCYILGIPLMALVNKILPNEYKQ